MPKSPEVQSKMQKMFEKSVKGLLKQRKKSEGVFKDLVGMNCLYRGPENTRCGVGFLITNKNYKPSFEGGMACRQDVFLAIAESQGLASGSQVYDDFLLEIQSIHDGLDVKNWASGFRSMAEEFDLDTTFMKGMR